MAEDTIGDIFSKTIRMTVIGLSSDAIRRRNVVAEEGRGNHTIVFVHGFGTNQSVWDSQVNAFRDRFRIMRFDHVGCGHSDVSAYTPKRYRSLYSYANDMLEICTALELKKCTFVAHSMGGMIALLASLMAPEFFHRLILVGASPRFLNDVDYEGGFSQEDIEKIYELASEDYASWAGGFAPAMIGEENPELAVYLTQTLKQIRPDIALSMLRIMFESDHRSELPQVQIPVSILQSRSDAAVPVFVGQYLHRQIPGSRYREFDISGHLPHLTAPNLVIDAIEATFE